MGKRGKPEKLGNRKGRRIARITWRLENEAKSIQKLKEIRRERQLDFPERIPHEIAILDTENPEPKTKNRKTKNQKPQN